jgi:hypothetical protein
MAPSWAFDHRLRHGQLKSQAEDARAARGAYPQLPEVRECHMLNGEIDFILKIVSRPAKLPGIPDQQADPRAQCGQREDSLTIRTAKHLPGVPLGTDTFFAAGGR